MAAKCIRIIWGIEDNESESTNFKKLEILHMHTGINKPVFNKQAQYHLCKLSNDYAGKMFILFLKKLAGSYLLLSCPNRS
jgi:hypothetical protein